MSTQLTALFEQSQESAAYMIREITHICKKLGKRGPGSRGEREAAEYMAGILQNDCGCTAVKTESFREHPDAFYRYFWFSAAFDCLCALLFFLSPWLSIASGLAALFLFLSQFVFYRQIIDPLFPERESVNVTAVRPCIGEVRNRIFLNGHIDAAWEFPLNYYFGGVVFEIPGYLRWSGCCSISAFRSVCCAVREAGRGLRDSADSCLFRFLSLSPLPIIRGVSLTGER
jgi:hypothetical protein